MGAPSPRRPAGRATLFHELDETVCWLKLGSRAVSASRSEELAPSRSSVGLSITWIGADCRWWWWPSRGCRSPRSPALFPIGTGICAAMLASVGLLLAGAVSAASARFPDTPAPVTIVVASSA
jgi:hypothetical protein